MHTRVLAGRYGRKWTFLGLAAIAASLFALADARAEIFDGGAQSGASRAQGTLSANRSAVRAGAGISTSTSVGTDRYVATNGSDGGGNTCANQAAPCQTIAYAVAQAAASDTIHVASGDYVQGAPISIATSGLHILGDAVNKPAIERTATFNGTPNQPLFVVNGASGVRLENLDLHIDLSYVAEGILASGFVDGLAIVDNHFIASKTLATGASFGFTNAISINDVRNSLNLPRVDGSGVFIDGNTIDGINGAVALRAGVNVDASLGTISNNTITAGTHDIHVRFATHVAASSASGVTIDHNILSGRGLEFAAPNANSGPVTISNNTITAPAGIDGNTPYPADWSLVRLIDNQQDIPTTVVGNTFQGHVGAYRGVLVENYPATTFVANTFTPATNAADFRSLVVSNKEIATGTPIAPYAMTLTAQGNTFNGSGIAGAGMAVELLDDNDANGTATFGSLLFGGAGAGEANSFDGNLRWYFHLDDVTCDNAGSTDCGFLNYPGVGTIQDTQMRPFATGLDASQNLYAGQAPSSATFSALQARTYDHAANPALGTVNYGASATETEAFVDDDFAGHGYGDALTFTSAAAGTRSVYFGVNAFATIPDGLAHVIDGGTVFVAKGTFAAAATISHPLQLIGDGNADANPANSTVLTGAVVVSASGASTAVPLLLRDLRISNAAGKGISVGSASHLAFDNIALAGNGDAGIDFGSQSDDIAISNSLFDGNTGAGLRTSTTAQVSHVTISGSTFSNNGAGIILFGASGSGNGQISNWAISNSQFLGNDNADSSGFGGGIWLKTGGAGSAIDGFSVTASTFDDNGSSASLNRVGITVRARPGTTLRNVSICSNAFAETPTPGTQLTGINVFDDTANTGYQPITVCADNTFSGLGHSISGLEQHELRGSQPVVNITGGSIANTEYINTPVTRVDDGATFPTIVQAMNDAGTVAGNTILLGSGVYRENVTVTHDNMTLTGADRSISVIDGGNLAVPGITLPNGRVGTTISHLAVQNVHESCVYGSAGNNNTTVTDTLLSGCRADLGGANGGGMYMNGPVDTVAFTANEVTASAARGFVIWNGFKTHITIAGNNVHDLVGCCGIDLQDGTASGITVSGNTVTNVGDSGIGLMQLTSGAGANLIAGNTLNNTGRFGIEIKNPNGTGLASGDGSIVVRNNSVVRPASPTSSDQRDVGGIVVIRRAFVASAGETDVTTGAIVSANTVTGWIPLAGSPNDGFGIVVEGTHMSVSGNTLSGNQIGVQFQAGNAGYPGDSDQAATNAFFARGDAPTTCALLGANTNTGNATDFRTQTSPAGLPILALVHNTTRGTEFCTIQSGIDDAATVAGDTISVDAGTFAENVVVDKSVALQGPKVGIAGYDATRDGSGEAVLSPASGIALRVLADNVTFDGFTISNVNNTAIASGGNYGGVTDNVRILDNRILNVAGGSGLYTNGPRNTPVTNWTVSRNLVDGITSPIGSGINLWAASGGNISDNHVQNSAFGGIQTNGGSTVQITGNVIHATAHNGINVAQSTDITVTGNSVTDANTSDTADEAGLTVYGGTSNATFACNTVGGSGSNGFSTASAITDAFSDIHVFDNAITTASSISHNLAQTIAIGSNWYGGSASVNGSNAAGAQVATALSATPIGSPFCGDNTTIGGVLAVSGTPQTTAVGTAFATPLKARVVDRLGGSIAGVTVGFAGPVSGASASMSPAAAVSDFDGIASVDATANALTGSYVAMAAAGSATADFNLTNAGQPSVALTLNGPPGAVAGTATPGYSAQLSNTGTALPENVLVQFVLSRAGGLASGDVVLAYDTGSGFAAIPLGACGSNLCGSFGPPGTGFAVGAGYNSTTQLQFTSNRSGAVTLSATVQGVTSSSSYAASAITVTVSGVAQDIAANGTTTFSGTAGALLAGAQPSVKVTDAGGDAVAGVAVTFAATAGNGTLVGATQTTDANGIATLGGWILDATPGTNTLTATAAGLNGSPVAFTAEGVAASGALSVTISDNRDYVQTGHALTYAISVGNNGSADLQAVAVADTVPLELDVGANAWQCVALNGAVCNAVASRDLSGTVDLPAHSSVIYLLSATVNGTGTDLVSNTIDATGPDGLVSATDTTAIVLFRDGFEVGGDGAQAAAPTLDGTQAPTLTAAQSIALDIAPTALASLRVTPVALAADGAFRVEAIRIGSAVYLRLVARNAATERFSAWSALGDNGAMLALGSDGKQLILVGTASDLDIALAKAGPFALLHAIE